jgi:hypothetical protein
MTNMNKINVPFDIKIVSLDVTSEEVCDGGRLTDLIDNASENRMII